MARTPKNQTISTDNAPEAQPEEWFIVSTTHGEARRRAGLGFTPKGTRVNVAALSEEQRAAIYQDPVLKIEPSPDAEPVAQEDADAVSGD